MTFPTHDDRPEARLLLENLRARLPDLEALLIRICEHWGYEDHIYRFYHQSFKVYDAQATTLGIVKMLQEILPDRPLNGWFMQIVAEGTGKTFVMDDNARWLEVTRPILEAFLHAKYFLEMAVRYARELEEPPNSMPSGWASILYLYDLR